MNFKTNILLCILFSVAILRKTCRIQNNNLKFTIANVCHRSNKEILSTIQAVNVEECIKLARKKNALAFNFSPQESARHLPKEKRNCEVLGCPEFGEMKTLVPDVAFDYYSAYKISNVTENATCVKSLGLFVTLDQEQTYLSSIKSCQDIGGDLADVTTETRTKYLSTIVNNTLDLIYKVAFVGLDDIGSKKLLVTAFGMPLTCSRYRAWAPGHPRFEHVPNSCVILGTDRMWSLVDCDRELPALCEIFPEPPQLNLAPESPKCDQFKNKTEENSCNTKALLWTMYKNASRIEKCTIVNEFLEPGISINRGGK